MSNKIMIEYINSNLVGVNKEDLEFIIDKHSVEEIKRYLKITLSGDRTFKSFKKLFEEGTKVKKSTIVKVRKVLDSLPDTLESPRSPYGVADAYRRSRDRFLDSLTPDQRVHAEKGLKGIEDWPRNA